MCELQNKQELPGQMQSDGTGNDVVCFQNFSILGGEKISINPTNFGQQYD
jgi:hypothetical protein